MKKRNLCKIIFTLFAFLLCLHPSFFCTLDKTENASAYPWIAHTIKEGYLVLVPKEDDKPLYQNYIQERIDEFDIRIVSLEEHGIANNAKIIKKFIYNFYFSFPFRFLSLDENIAYGFRKFSNKSSANNNKLVMYDEPYISDFYYSFNDPYFDTSISERTPAFFIGRIKHTFLSKFWTNQNEQKALIALPFREFAHRNMFCKGCIDDPVDYASYGEQLKSMLSFLNIKTVSMYEKRGSKPSKHISDQPLNAVNFEKELTDSTFLFSACTSEPILFKKYEYDEDPATYEELVTTYWDDMDHDGVVDEKSKELTFESFYPCKDQVSNTKKIGFLISNGKLKGLDQFYCSISSFQGLNQINAYLDIDNYLRIFQSFLLGSSIGEALHLYSTYSSGGAFSYSYTPFVLFGPPETTIDDFITKKKIHKIDKENYLILVKEETDKKLFDSYIEERSERYNVNILSLEEKKIESTPGKVKNLINDLLGLNPIKYLVLYENIPYGTVYRDENNLISDMFYLLNNTRTDQYEEPVDKSQFMHKVFISRISKTFLQQVWKPSFNFKTTIALPVEYYARHCEKPGYFKFVEYQSDYAVLGNWLEHFLYTKNLECTTLYETRGDLPSSYNCDLSLTKETLLSEIKNSSIVYMTTTSEPGRYPVFPSGQIVTQAEPKIVTSYWNDLDRDGFVDLKNTELQYENLFTFTEEIGNQKRIVFCPLKTKLENPGIFYNVLTTSESLIGKKYIVNTNGWCLNEVFRNLYQGCSISEAFQLDLASGNKDLKIAFVLWGPPETKLVDLFR